jgi:hypothetical protein
MSGQFHSLLDYQRKGGNVMSTLKWFILPVLFFIVMQPSFADDGAKVVGIWKIVSWESEFQATGEREPVMGESLTSYIILTSEGWMMTVITGEGRKQPKTDQDRADLLKSMFAYTGTYRLKEINGLPRLMVTASTSCLRGYNRLPDPRKGWGEPFTHLILNRRYRIFKHGRENEGMKTLQDYTTMYSHLEQLMNIRDVEAMVIKGRVDQGKLEALIDEQSARYLISGNICQGQFF